jgi:hypothetical protein
MKPPNASVPVRIRAAAGRLSAIPSGSAKMITTTVDATVSQMCSPNLAHR